MSLPPLSGDDHFLDCLERFHGITLTHDDLAILHKDLNDRRQQSARSRFNVSQADDQWIAVYEINSGKIGQIVLGTAMGFLSGGWLGAGLALLGGILSTSQSKPKQQNQRISEQYGFDQGGQIAPSGGTLPRIYGNRSINPAGGVRVSGILIHSRVETRRGTNLLYQLYVIAAGESAKLGYGQLGSIATELTLFNQQPRRNFNDREIRIMTRLGTQNQTAIPEFPYYSQNITPPDYSVFGVDSRAKVGSPSVTPNTGFSLINATVTNQIARKTIVTNAWDSGVFGQSGLQADGQFSFTNPSGTVAVGLSSVDQDQSNVTMQFGFLIQNSTVVVSESGNVRTGAIPLNSNSTFVIELDDNRIYYRIDGALIYTSTLTPPLPLYPDIALFSTNSSVSGLNVSDSGFAVQGGITGTLQPTPNQGSSSSDQEVLDLFTPSQDYCLKASGEVVRDPRFYVVDKDRATKRITTSPGIPNASGTIYAYWVARYETTKRVDRVDFNLVFSLSARHQGKDNDKDNGKLVTHGALFDVWIRPTSDPIGAEVRLIRLVVKNRTGNKTYRGFRVMNLKLGRYYFELRPLTDIPGDQNIPIYELTDNGYGITDDTDTEQLPTYPTGVTILGNAIAIQGELEPIGNLAEIRKWIGYDKKTSVSSESGATGRLNSVNEIVHWQSIGRTIETYPGLALTGYRFMAGERLQQSPAVSSLVHEASVVPNWLVAGYSSGLSSPTVLSAPGQNFIGAGVQAGIMIRNLDKLTQAQIIAVTPSTITTATSLNWNTKAGDRFAVYYLGATCFFPDVFADAIRNDFGGIPELLDPDEYIDYPSIANSRAFCVTNKYYFDDLVDQKVPFAQWAEEQARYSHLYATRIDGRFGLTPDIQTPIDAVFNSANSRNFKLDYPDWQGNVINTIVIRFIDGREVFDQSGARHREITVTVQTEAAFQGLVSPFIEEVNARSVKNTEQAINVACLRLKSLRQDIIGISFETSYAAAYVQAGDITSIQHSAIDIGEDYSGFVTEKDSDYYLLDGQPVICEGIMSEDKADGVMFTPDPYYQPPVSIGDLLVNRDTKEYGVIQSVTAGEINAPVQFNPNDEWQVVNLTMPVGYEAKITYRENDVTESSLARYELRDGLAWLHMPRSQADVLDSVNVSPPTQQWRIQSVSPNGKESFAVSALSHDPDIYSRRGLVVQVDDRTVRS